MAQESRRDSSPASPQKSRFRASFYQNVEAARKFGSSPKTLATTTTNGFKIRKSSKLRTKKVLTTSKLPHGKTVNLSSNVSSKPASTRPPVDPKKKVTAMEFAQTSKPPTRKTRKVSKESHDSSSSTSLHHSLSDSSLLGKNSSSHKAQKISSSPSRSRKVNNDTPPKRHTVTNFSDLRLGFYSSTSSRTNHAVDTLKTDPVSSISPDKSRASTTKVALLF